MRFSILFVCLIGMVLLSSIAMGDIVLVNDDWDGSEENCYGNFVGSQAWASASGDDTDEDGWAKGGYGHITTVTEWLHWQGYGSAYAWVHVYVYDEWPCSAESDSEGWSTHTNKVEAYAYVDETYVWSPPGLAYRTEDPDPDYNDDETMFNAYTGIWAGHQVNASASICSGSDNLAYAESDAIGACELYEPE